MSKITVWHRERWGVRWSVDSSLPITILDKTLNFKVREKADFYILLANAERSGTVLAFSNLFDYAPYKIYIDPRVLNEVQSRAVEIGDITYTNPLTRKKEAKLVIKGYKNWQRGFITGLYPAGDELKKWSLDGFDLKYSEGFKYGEDLEKVTIRKKEYLKLYNSWFLYMAGRSTKPEYHHDKLAMALVDSKGNFRAWIDQDICNQMDYLDYIGYHGCVLRDDNQLMINFKLLSSKTTRDKYLPYDVDDGMPTRAIDDIKKGLVGKAALDL